MRNSNNTIERKKHTIDASNEIFGRLSTKIAYLLRGKNKPQFYYNKDIGDYVVIKNVGKIKFSGKKLDTKLYKTHSGYLGNLKIRTLKESYVKDPKKILINAVYNMLPKNRLRKLFLKRLKFE